MDVSGRQLYGLGDMAAVRSKGAENVRGERAEELGGISGETDKIRRMDGGLGLFTQELYA